MAQENQELPDGLVDGAPLLGSGLAGFVSCGSFDWAVRNLSDGRFDDLGGDFAATGLLNGVLPGELSLIRGQSNQRADLGLALGLFLTIIKRFVTWAAEIRR